MSARIIDDVCPYMLLHGYCDENVCIFIHHITSYREVLKAYSTYDHCSLSYDQIPQFLPTFQAFMVSSSSSFYALSLPADRLVSDVFRGDYDRLLKLIINLCDFKDGNPRLRVGFFKELLPQLQRSRLEKPWCVLKAKGTATQLERFLECVCFLMDQLPLFSQRKEKVESLYQDLCERYKVDETQTEKSISQNITTSRTEKEIEMSQWLNDLSQHPPPPPPLPLLSVCSSVVIPNGNIKKEVVIKDEQVLNQIHSKPPEQRQDPCDHSDPCGPMDPCVNWMDTKTCSRLHDECHTTKFMHESYSKSLVHFMSFKKRISDRDFSNKNSSQFFPIFSPTYTSSVSRTQLYDLLLPFPSRKNYIYRFLDCSFLCQLVEMAPSSDRFKVRGQWNRDSQQERFQIETGREIWGRLIFLDLDQHKCILLILFVSLLMDHLILRSDSRSFEEIKREIKQMEKVMLRWKALDGFNSSQLFDKMKLTRTDLSRCIEEFVQHTKTDSPRIISDSSSSKTSSRFYFNDCSYSQRLKEFIDYQKIQENKAGSIFHSPSHSDEHIFDRLNQASFQPIISPCLDHTENHWFGSFPFPATKSWMLSFKSRQAIDMFHELCLFHHDSPYQISFSGRIVSGDQICGPWASLKISGTKLQVLMIAEVMDFLVACRFPQTIEGRIPKLERLKDHIMKWWQNQCAAPIKKTHSRSYDNYDDVDNIHSTKKRKMDSLSSCFYYLRLNDEDIPCLSTFDPILFPCYDRVCPFQHSQTFRTPLTSSMIEFGNKFVENYADDLLLLESIVNMSHSYYSPIIIFSMSNIRGFAAIPIPPHYAFIKQIQTHPDFDQACSNYQVEISWQMSHSSGNCPILSRVDQKWDYLIVKNSDNSMDSLEMKNVDLSDFVTRFHVLLSSIKVS